MLFRRKGALINAVIFLIFFATSYGQTQNKGNARSYDTNDWIPVSRPAAPGESSQADAPQKRPTGRVLNLPLQDEKRFFPVEQQPSPNQQQQLLQNQRQLPPQPTFIPNGQQQILLPPQLQSLLTQGQSFISPQKLNHQLLPPQTQEYPILPTQSFPVNSTDYNSQDVIQNINLALYNQQPVRQQQVPPQHNNDQPEVQLLYVPLENLQRQRGQRQQQQQQQQIVFPTEQAVAQAQTYHPPIQQQQQQLQQQLQHHHQHHPPSQHKQVQLQNIEQEFVQQALQAQKLQEQFQHNVQPVTQQSYRRPFPELVQQQQKPTAAPKKRKPHQPPLAVYMGTGQQEIKIGDVLSLLKDAKTISVQDTISHDSPQVFVGPSHLEPPDGYAKFDLPYLSSIENNRVERKVDQLPFFVAPLSYKAPPGYSKIPFPSPHVGSVVINHAKAIPSTTTEHSNFVSSQTLEETSSQIPFLHSEVSTVRTTRGRQRQPSRNSFSSTVEPPSSAEVPYGPLPTKITPEVQQPHSVQDIISTNPYGPTRFVQSTTPAIYNKEVNIPEEIFSTKNRFSTASPNFNNYQQNQYRSESTESTLVSSTFPEILANDKYTVLEQFPIRQKQNVPQTEEPVHRGSIRQHSRRPTQEPYRTDSAERTALPLVLSTHISNQQNFEIPYQQQFVQNYDDESTRQTYREPPKQRVTESYQETPTRQRVTENYQHATQPSQVRQSSNEDFDGPVRQTQVRGQRVTENYQHVTQPSHIRQSSNEDFDEPVRQAQVRGQRVTENYQHVTQPSHIRQSSNEDFDEPVRQAQVRGQRVTENYQHVTQPSHIRQSSNEDFDVPVRHNLQSQQYTSENYEQNPQFSSESQTSRTRGRQHFTPDNYFQGQFEQNRDKSTEPLVTVTKEPIIEYNLPIEHINHQISDRPQLQNSYLQDDNHDDVIPSKQEYTLPAKLPPISPQLAGLINSLQDQQLRPLLAPLLLPPSEEPPIEETRQDSSEEYYSSPEPEAIKIPVTTTTTTTTTTTITPPPTETTTQYKRPRSRQRGTRPTTSYEYVSSTTDIPRKTSQYRGRRPYNGQPRQEYKPRESYSVSTTSQPEIIEATTRPVVRNRQPPPRQYISSTTEQQRRTTPSPRQKFRTRGRPVKFEEDYTERNTQDNSPVFKQPVLEGGFQASPPLLQQNIQLSVPSSRDEQIVSQRPQQEQALLYVENTNKPTLQEANPIYIPRQQFVSSTDSAEQIHHSTISATGPDNNFVPDVLDQPTILSTQQQLKYNNNVETNLNLQEENTSSEETNVPLPQIRHNPEPVRREPSTTEAIRSRTRVRGKTRRINTGGSSPSPRYQASYSSSTTQRTTTEAKQEEEFYGFFRQPNFGKSQQTEPPKPEFVAPSPTPSPRPNFVYLTRTEEPQQRVYINPERSQVASTNKPFLPVTREDDSYVEPNIQVQRQYISSSTAPSSSAEPITRRPIIRTRRPVNTPVRSSDSTSTSDQSDERFYVRPTKRPELQTTRPTRIRGRIRKPTHPATVQSVETHSKSNELENNSEEYVPRQRVINRGKSHFQSPKSEKVLEPEEDNYPINFLQNHGVQHSSPGSPSASSPQPVILTTANPSTGRPAFQLTIEPEDSVEYPDQEPLSSVNRPSIANKDLEQGVEESKFSSKIVEKPSNFNYIVSDEKSISTTEKYTETEMSSTTINGEEKTEEPIISTTAKYEEVENATTELPATTTEVVTEKPKSRRRGAWKLVRTRPVVDEFESAESQNVESVFNDNNFAVGDKPIRKYKVVQRIRTTTEAQIDTTTPVIVETTLRPQDETTTIKYHDLSNSKSSILAPLLEMFGFKSEQSIDQEEILETTTENFNTLPDDIGTTILPNNSTEIPVTNDVEKSSTDDAWKSRIIGTSTTTEISHETEICYRGRCVKSASTEEDSEAGL